MDTTVRGVSSCRHCQFYKMEGRRGGFCHQLGVLVQGRWRACSFASPLFAAPNAANAAALVSLQEALELEAVALQFSEGESELEIAPAEPFVYSEELPAPLPFPEGVVVELLTPKSIPV